MHTADGRIGDSQEEECPQQCLQQYHRQPVAQPLEQGRYKPLPQAVECEHGQCEQQHPQLLTAEKRYAHTTPEQREEGNEINEIGQKGSTGRTRHAQRRDKP